MEYTENKQGVLPVKRSKFLVFDLNGKSYGIPLSKIKEVIRIPDITPLPKVPKFYKGLINVRGQIISVIDLRTKLDLPEKAFELKRTSIIISHVGEILVGSIVDEICEVTSFEDTQINTQEADRVDHFDDGVYGIAKNESNELTLLIDLEKALAGTAFNLIKSQSRGAA